MTREQVKQWVVIKSRVHNPYGDRVFTAATTLAGMDIYGEGDTIEKAYNDLTDIIFNSSMYTKSLSQNQSFKAFNPE